VIQGLSGEDCKEAEGTEDGEIDFNGGDGIG
jgi:hypothetical protein